MFQTISPCQAWRMLRLAMVALMVALLPVSGLCLAQEPMEVRTPAPENPDDPRFAWSVEVLRMALQATEQDFGPWKLVLESRVSDRTRLETELEKGGLINVALLPSCTISDKRFMRVSHVADRGLLGYRVAIIRAGEQNKFSGVKTLNDLAAFAVASGRNWHISKIFIGNDLPVTLWPDLDGLYNLLSIGRVDYLSRSVYEVMRELDHYKQTYPDLAIEQTLLVRTPIAMWLYVSVGEDRLKERLEAGMDRILANGALKTRFDALFRKDLEALNLKSRHVIMLNDPDAHGPTLAIPTTELLTGQ
ncbi:MULTISPECIES: amino acid ABC transporter substrate-binding protein [unclassified Haematospirillum]|uniref:amino acid ABC transporter substrate-binding protein n=1 Tax=unclassified Haematospirillum TaxID=2622088 RepID=UPI001439B545|nr:MULTISPECIES: amino acid ABC transporter substrate-binding protein [unclassified Haematospirillum]NKD54473.1 amino acid ABC transporter substrate-binding protein [Haematospirillum sp. H4890]NKD74516.1 amino acid ABC transporter substrate-binding protein [Haematospirillum sp. H4485]NKD86811.1 amino acid ABC transporter substrate-binding protein [Haematospirillum sp. 15-248]